MSWYNSWDDFKGSGAAYALNPAMALGADSMGLGGGAGALSGGLLGDRADNPYQNLDRNNFNLPGYQQQQDRVNRFFDQQGNSQAAQAGQSDFRGGQRDLAGMLMGQARGQNSVSAEQLRQAADSNIGQQQALAATGRGNPALAQLAASQNAGRINQGLAGQQAVAGLQERNMAMGQLGNVLMQGRGADEQLGMFNAGQSNQFAQNRAQNQLGAMGMGANLSGMQQNGGMGYEAQNTNRYLAHLGMPTQQEVFMGGVTGVLGATATGQGGG